MNGAIATAVSGLTASSMWMDATASNIANSGDTETVPSSSQSNAQGAPATFQPVTVSLSSAASGGVSAQITPVRPATIPVYDPSSPAANAQGMAAMPNVDLATQLVNMAEASISYRASLAVYRAANAMDKATLDMIA
jgi:flagellar basal-body rod protein FlgC